MYELSGDTLAAEDSEAGIALAAQAHEEQHALLPCRRTLAGRSLKPQRRACADMVAMNGMESHAHDDTTVIDVDGLLIENARLTCRFRQARGSVWLTLTNTAAVDEALTGAEVPGCGVVELHDMKMENDVMVMFPVEGGVKS
ncbi:MAG: copper chaperone PCu(A)C [Caldilineaceae bacterium]